MQRILKVSGPKSELIAKLSTSELLLKLTGIDINICPCCKGKMSTKRKLQPKTCAPPGITVKTA